MLKIFKYKETKQENIAFDIYTPINIEFGMWNISKEPTIYWRTGDFQSSLIEIGIGKYKKDIRSITLSICKNVYEIEYCIPNNMNILKGSPIVGLENMNNETYIDEKGMLNVYIESESVSIIFSENKICECLQNNNIAFYLDANKSLIGLRIHKVSEENKTILKEALA